jgi:hypothetical protein
MLDATLFAAIKIAVSIGFVVALSLIVEMAGPRIAGIISGYPLGAAISLYFISLENGTAFAANSAIYTAAGLSATIAFVWGYLWGIYLATNKNRITAIAVSVFIGLVFYGSTVWVLSCLPIHWVSAPLIAILVLALSALHFKKIPDSVIQKKVRLNTGTIFIRAGFAAAVILAITTVAGVIGPIWAGLFSAFPISMLPFLVIVHSTYAPEHVQSIIKNVPRGMVSLLVYTMVIAVSYPAVGTAWGTVSGYIAATACLLLFSRSF